MRTCLSCGARMEDTRRRCAECGTPLGPQSSQREFITDPDELLAADDIIADDEPSTPSLPPGVWRHGHLLVMRKNAVLPPRCVKSNQPTDLRLKRAMYWHHPAVFLAIFAGLLIYVIIALVIRQSATVHVGLSPAWFRRRRWGIATGWLMSLSGVGLIIAGANVQGRNVPYLLMWGGFVMAVFLGPLYGLLRSRMVAPTRITEQHVWIKGVHPSYLAELRPAPSELY